LLFVTRMSENLRRAITLSLVYRDDASRPNPPEDVPGTVPLVGYRGRGIEKLPGGRYEFALRIYTLPGYRRGDERRLLAQLDASPPPGLAPSCWPATSTSPARSSPASAASRSANRRRAPSAAGRRAKRAGRMSAAARSSANAQARPVSTGNRTSLHAVMVAKSPSGARPGRRPSAGSAAP